MNSHQRRKILRKTGKIINMNSTRCFFGHKARPTDMGYWCPKCQEWGYTKNQRNK